MLVTITVEEDQELHFKRHSVSVSYYFIIYHLHLFTASFNKHILSAQVLGDMEINKNCIISPWTASHGLFPQGTPV